MNKAAFNNRQMQQIKSALHNTLDKTKAHIRRSGEIPTAEAAFQWFQSMSEVAIVRNKDSIDASNNEINLFEAIFFFNELQVHLHLYFDEAEYRGHPYFNANSGFTFINELNPDDYFDEKKIEYLNTKFNLKL